MATHQPTLLRREQLRSPTGLGIITGHCDNAAVSPQNLLLSTANCTITFPASTTGDDVVTASYGGDSKNASASGTETISFGPAAATPEGSASP